MTLIVTCSSRLSHIPCIDTFLAYLILLRLRRGRQHTSTQLNELKTNLQLQGVEMDVRVVLLVIVALSCVEGRARHRQRPRIPRRFPKPETWMLYSTQYDPVIEEKGCVDLRGAKCTEYANNPGYCHYQKDYMKKFCRKSCKWCTGGRDYTPIRSLAQPQINGGGGQNDRFTNGFLNGGCEDILEDCSKYIKNPEDCKIHSAVTKKYCARTCMHCCNDQLPECSAFIKHPSQCTSLNGFFRKYCPYTCKYCGPPQIPVKREDCVDEISECRSFQIQDCRIHEAFARKYCAKHCRYCEPLETTTVKLLTNTPNINAKSNSILSTSNTITLPSNEDGITTEDPITSFVEPVRTAYGFTDSLLIDTETVTLPPDADGNIGPTTESVTMPVTKDVTSTESAKWQNEQAITTDSAVLYVIEDTTTAPEGTTTAPEGTTTAPEDTTTAPEDTTTAPEGTTTAPEGTTTAPEGTTTAPEGTTTAPEDTTTAPDDITTAPDDPKTAPKETTTAPEGTTTAPDDPTTAPDDQTTAPKETTTAPKEPTTAPKETTTAPEGTTTAPEDTTTAPEGTTTAPEGTTTAPEGTTTAPDDPTTAPDDPTTAPKETTTAPEGTTTATATTAALGTASTANESAPPTDSAAPFTDSAAPTTDFVAPATDSVATTTDSVATTTDDVATTTDSVATTTDSVAPPTDNVATTTHSVTPTTDDVAPTTDNVATTTDSVATTTDSVSPTTDSVAPTTDDVAPTTNYVTTTIENAVANTESATIVVNIPTNSSITATVPDINVKTNFSTNSVYNGNNENKLPVTKSLTQASENGKTSSPVTESLTQASENGKTSSPVTESLTQASENGKTEHVASVTSNPLTFTGQSTPLHTESDPIDEKLTTYIVSLGGTSSESTEPLREYTVTPTQLTESPTTKQVTETKRQKDDNKPTIRQKIRSTTKTRSVCEDRLKECPRLVAKNKEYCQTQVDYMKEYCRKSCRFCATSSQEPTIKVPRCKDKRKRKCKMYSKFQGYCTINKKYMAEVCAKSCGFCGVSPDEIAKKMSYIENNKKYEFSISTKWDGSPINHNPIKFTLSAEDNLNVRLEVSGPFFDQPGKPPCLAGQPCWQLWNYEVAEVFFLGEKEKYLELEVSPYGPHLLLLLDGVRKPFKTKLPMRYSASIDHAKKTWNGTAIVPIDYFPPDMKKINAYAIHGPDNAKVYESLYPAKNTAYPDFHRLQFFQDFKFKSMFPQGWKQPMSPFWVARL